ncbi:hypothetical protein J6590_098947, partial [Homalodisca vitripennis]
VACPTLGGGSEVTFKLFVTSLSVSEGFLAPTSPEQTELYGDAGAEYVDRRFTGRYFRLLCQANDSQAYKTKEAQLNRADTSASVVRYQKHANRKLLNKARVVKREKQYTYLWVRNGRIIMRKNPGDRFVVD